MRENLRTDDGRTLQAGLYGHRHDGTNGERLLWWFWDTANEDEPDAVSLLAGDPRIPCEHAHCPADHVHDGGGNGQFKYLAGAHYFGADSFRVREYTYDNGQWQDEDGTTLSPGQEPCIHPDH